MDDRLPSDILRREYGLQVQRVAYYRRSWVAHCYVVQCVGDVRYSCKNYERESQARFYARNTEFYLALCDQLVRKRLLPTVAHPVAALDKRISLAFDDHLLILFPWIEGRTVGCDGFADEVSAQMATSVGLLHKSSPEIEWPNPPPSLHPEVEMGKVGLCRHKVR